VESIAAPFDEAARESGLARSALPSNDATVWRVRLREGVRFQDGSPLNAEAVLANAARWQESGAARTGLPEFLADGPRPDLVRFILAASDPEFGARLAAPELGIVSRRALRRASAERPFPIQLSGTGTGPFELRERSSESMLLARNTDWWGTDAELGPALDQLEFTAAPFATERLELLESGSAQVASGLQGGILDAVRENPLLAIVHPPSGLVAERSVRGLDPDDARAPMLNHVWMTGIAPG
jgi:peptide/nickel transport system substrate-binding protein